MMAPIRLMLSLSAVFILSLAASFALLFVLSGKNSLSLGDENVIDLTSSFNVRLWGMLLGLCAGGFSIGQSLAPENQAIRYLFSSYGGDWFLLVTAALVLVGLFGGLLSKHAWRGALASGIALLILTFLGVLLTATELPNIARGLDLPSGNFSQFLSAVEISQVIGGCFSALVAGLMGALGGRALQYREKIPIDAVKAPTITFVKPEAETNAVPTSEPTSEIEQGASVLQPARTEPDILEASGPSEVLERSERGPLSKSPPCPHCGTPLVWVPEVKRYYCKVCAIYP